MIPINAFDPFTLLLIALLNPATILVGFIMGRGVDQWQKLFIAAFAAAVSGFLAYWMAAFVGIFSVHALGGEAALVTLGYFYGLGWAIIGRFFRPKTTNSIFEKNKI
ncbi:MAG: hypothetical protein ACKOW3_05775 [Hyphomicrobium sp.]